MKKGLNNMTIKYGKKGSVKFVKGNLKGETLKLQKAHQPKTQK